MNSQRVHQLIGLERVDPFDVAESDSGEGELRDGHVGRLDVHPGGVRLELVHKGAQQREGRDDGRHYEADPDESGIQEV